MNWLSFNGILIRLLILMCCNLLPHSSSPINKKNHFMLLLQFLLFIMMLSWLNLIFFPLFHVVVEHFCVFMYSIWHENAIYIATLFVSWFFVFYWRSFLLFVDVVDIWFIYSFLFGSRNFLNGHRCYCCC